MKKWSEQKRGILVLPTGSEKNIQKYFGCYDYGKNQSLYFSACAYHRVAHSMDKNLKEYFSCKIGMLGG